MGGSVPVRGWLEGSFRPAEQANLLPTLVRDQADWPRRMQKALNQMNVRVH
jgi:hypothetical protein